MRAAGKLYQKTYKGRMNHAKRQKRYKKQKLNSLTHHPSQETSTNDLLRSETNEGVKMISSDGLRCHFCGRSCSLLLRTSTLARNKIFTPGVWPKGP